MSKTSVVVLAVDGSQQCEDAFNWYLAHLHREGNKVILAHAMEAPSMPSRDEWEAQSAAGRKKSKECEDKFIPKLQELKIDCDFEAGAEKPGEYVVQVANKNKADFIVMGTRGLGKVRRTIMGSVSDYVVHHAHCPVLVCRQK